MKTSILFLILSLTISISSYSQKEKRNHLGVNLSLANNNNFTYLEYERFLGKHISIAPRVGLFTQKEEHYGNEESGKGLGAGFSFRWHFGQKPAQGFFLGTGVDVYIYNYLGYFYWDSQIAAYLQAGYHIPLGKSFYLQPIIAVGESTKVESFEGEDTSSGFFRGGFTFGIRF
jgi:hypothetical protein